MTKRDDKRVPALRFKGFTDEWEQRKPGDFLVESKIIGHKGDKAKKLTVKLWGKGVQEKQDILSGSANTQYYIRKSGQLMYGKLDFLHAAFGIVPSQLNNYESTIDSPSFDVKSANSIFLLNLFLRKKFYLYYGERANGSRKAKRIHEKDFLVMPIKMPEINEQNKISNLIEIVNNRITLQQRKVKQLKLLRRALQQQIMPFIYKENGMHFVKSKQNWNLISLNKILKERKKLTSDGNIPLVSLTKDGVIPKNSRYNREFLVKDKNKKYKLTRINDIVYNPANLKFGVINRNKLGTAKFSPIYVTLATNLKFDPAYIELIITDKDFISYSLRYEEGTVYERKAVKPQDLLSIKVNCPDKLIQTRIVNFFELITVKIKDNELKLKSFNNLKHFLLQNMFI